MRRLGTPAALALAVLLLAVAGSLRSNVVRTASRPAKQVISQPATWTPFTADLNATQPGLPDTKGTYSRSSDGSFRMEQASADGSLVIISIAKIADQRAYLYHSMAGKWITRPLLLPATGYRPPKPRAIGATGVSAVPERHGNLEVYRITSPTGEVTLEAPLLNFHPVVTIGKDGETTVLDNIRVVEPSAELFKLPRGVTPEIVLKGIPMGIPMGSGRPISKLPADKRP